MIKVKEKEKEKQKEKEKKKEKTQNCSIDWPAKVVSHMSRNQLYVTLPNCDRELVIFLS
jgi:hypothetical protein